MLTRFIGTSGILLAGIPELTRGKTSPGLHGRFSTEQALAQLLSEQGLEAVRGADGAYTLRVLPQTQGEQRLPVVTVTAKAEDDPTRTEGTGSYTTRAVTIGSKTPLSIRETPQSVSVITRQRIEDQNLTDLTSALNQATGITITQGHNNSSSITYSSRGFTIDTFQIDGGAAMVMTDPSTNLSSNYGNDGPDLAIYDHVEILRGADGLFTGAGDPGAVINLVHKRPLDHQQVAVEGDVGSWRNYRAVLDTTTPPAFDGRLRGRLVTVYEDRDYFYDKAFSKKTLLYGITEYDLSPSTLLTVGGDFEHRDTNPGPQYGLPRYSTGADLELPRSTCLCTDWEKYNFNDLELFANLKQQFGPDWVLKLNFEHLRQSGANVYLSPLGAGVNPVTQSGVTINGYQRLYETSGNGVDATLNGTFRFLGRPQDVVIGASWQRRNLSYASYNLYPAGNQSVDVFHFDPSTLSQPPVSPYPYQAQPYDDNYQEQVGFYSTLRLHMLDHLSLIGGARLSGYRLTANYVAGYDSNGKPSLYGTTPPTQSPLYPLVLHDYGVVTPYGGLVYDLTSHYSLYASYADIFVPQSNYLDEAGKPLRPLTGLELETGVKGAWLNGMLNASLAAFRINRKNVASLVFTGTGSYATGTYCCYDATGNIESEGFEGEVTGQLLPGWQMYAGYTYNLSRYKDGYGTRNGLNQSTFTPKHLFRLWTSYQLPGRLKNLSLGAGVNAQTAIYVSGSVCPAYDDTGTCTGSTVPYNYVQGFYAIFSARAGYRINNHWSAGLNLNNLADRRYYQTMGTSGSGNFYGEPRNFMLTLRGNW